MKQYIYLVFCFFVFLGACKSENTANQHTDNQGSKTAVPKDFTFSLYQGHWLDKVFFETVKQKRSFTSVKDVPPILEIIFPSEYNDSLWLISANKEEKTKLKPKSADSLAFSGGILSYNNTGGVEVLDWIDSKGQVRVFERVNDPINTQVKGSPSLLTSLVNRNTLMGDYFKMNEKGQKTDDFIVFKADGKIIGLQDYNSYKVCYTQDCLKLAGEKADVLYLSKDGKEGEYFVWEMIDYDTENEKEENKLKKKKKYGLVLTLYKINIEKGKTTGSFKKDKASYEFTVAKLG